jgi:hypothetical protein
VFEITAPIQSPAKCEVRSVIRILNAKGESPTEIHKQIVAVYGNVLNPQNVTEWCREFSKGRTDVHDEQTNGRPPLISDYLLQETEGGIRASRRVTIREFHHIIPEVSKTTIHEAVTEIFAICANFSFNVFRLNLHLFYLLVHLNTTGTPCLKNNFK